MTKKSTAMQIPMGLSMENFVMFIVFHLVSLLSILTIIDGYVRAVFQARCVGRCNGFPFLETV